MTDPLKKPHHPLAALQSSHTALHCTASRDRQYQPFTWSWLGGQLHGWHQAQYRSSSGSGVGQVPSFAEESLLTHF